MYKKLCLLQTGLICFMMDGFYKLELQNIWQPTLK